MKYGMTTDDFDAILAERGCDYVQPRDRLGDDEGNPLPPAYRDLATGDKYLLWHAHDLGRVIQFWNGLRGHWEDSVDFDPVAGFAQLRYRVKPDPDVDDEGNPLPPRYCELSAGDKGLLWLAHQEGRVIQYWHEADRMDPEWYWEDDDEFDPTACDNFSKLRYRVKPEPEPEEEVDDEGTPLPPLYCDLDDEDQSLLWLAHHGDRGVQAWNRWNRRWEDKEDDVFFGNLRYRVKPESEHAAPARLPVKIQGPGAKVLGTGTMIYRDGEWDFDSLEVD